MLDWTDEQYDTYLRLRDILDAAMAQVSGNEYKFLVFLLRRSFGDGLETANLCLPDFSDTGMSRASVIRCIASLTKRGLISRTVARSRGGHLYRISHAAFDDLTND